MSRELNCMNCSIGDFKHELCDCDNGFCKEFKSIGTQEDFFNAVIQRIRPQGEWIPCTKEGLPLTELGRRERQKWYGYKCSKCNFIYKGNALTESPFCQNCGAKMKGTDDGRNAD